MISQLLSTSCLAAYLSMVRVSSLRIHHRDRVEVDLSFMHSDGVFHHFSICMCMFVIALIHFLSFVASSDRHHHDSILLAPLDEDSVVAVSGKGSVNLLEVGHRSLQR